MAPESPDYEKLEPIPHRYAYSGLVLTVIIFQLINRVVVKVGLPETVDARDTWKWRNLFISWIHAVIVGTWDLLCFALYPEMIYDPLNYRNYFLYAMLICSTGYFIYDFLDMLLNNKLIKLWELSVHHITILTIFGYNVSLSHCLPYNAVALLAEVNSIFLHARKLLQMKKVSFSGLFYRIVIWLNLGTLLIFRFGALAVLEHGLFYHRSDLSWTNIFILRVSIGVIWVVNVGLLSRLLKSDIYRVKGGAPKKEDNGCQHFSVGANNNVKLKSADKSKTS